MRREAGIRGDGIGKSITAHSLRATMIQWLLDAGHPETVVANRSGHRSLGSLKHYSHRGDAGKKVQYDLFCAAAEPSAGNNGEGKLIQASDTKVSVSEPSVKRNDDKKSIRDTIKKRDSKQIEAPKPIDKRSKVSDAQLSTLSALQIPSGSNATINIGNVTYNNSPL